MGIRGSRRGTRPADVDGDSGAGGVLGLGLAGRGARGAAPAATTGEPRPRRNGGGVYGANGNDQRSGGSSLPMPGVFHDMLGNVWEWVADPYNGKMFPDAGATEGRAGPVLKGGGFASDVKNAICATHGFGPGDGFAVGFRIVKDLP